MRVECHGRISFGNWRRLLALVLEPTGSMQNRHLPRRGTTRAAKRQVKKTSQNYTCSLRLLQFQHSKTHNIEQTWRTMETSQISGASWSAVTLWGGRVHFLLCGRATLATWSRGTYDISWSISWVIYVVMYSCIICINVISYYILSLFSCQMYTTIHCYSMFISSVFGIGQYTYLLNK